MVSKVYKYGVISVRRAKHAAATESRPLWKLLHLQPLFATAPRYGGAVCEDLFARGLCLPSGSAMTDTDPRRVAEALAEGLG